jgi:hypothetical protein
MMKFRKTDDSIMKFAVIGKPNVGKSSRKHFHNQTGNIKPIYPAPLGIQLILINITVKK